MPSGKVSGTIWLGIRILQLNIFTSQAMLRSTTLKTIEELLSYLQPGGPVTEILLWNCGYKRSVSSVFTLIGGTAKTHFFLSPKTQGDILKEKPLFWCHRVF